MVVGSEKLEEFQLDDQKAWRLKNRATIGTHSGLFHCDEVLACSLLLWTDKFTNPMIVRTRNQDILDSLDLVCDVGGVYDPSTMRFDHH